MNVALRWKKAGFGVLQGAVLGPALLNILHSNLYLGIDNIDIGSYADNNNIYDTGELLFSWEECSKIIFSVLYWLSIKILNKLGLHLIMSGKHLILFCCWN